MTGQTTARRAAGRGRAMAAVVLCLAAAGLSTACGDNPEPSPGTSTEMPENATKSGDGTERHDLDPLTSRIPVLQGAEAATWYSGTLGSRDVPGPSLYWIDAVLTLPSGTADELRSTLDLTPAAEAPDVVEALRPALPEGDLLSGAELDEAFSHQGWQSTAYLSATGDELVLVVVGA